MHYLSDVVFGAAIGSIAGRTVVHHAADYWAFMPVSVPGALLSVGDPQGARIEINQFPIMAIARYRLSLTTAEVSLRAGAGVSLARTRLTPPPLEASR